MYRLTKTDMVETLEDVRDRGAWADTLYTPDEEVHGSEKIWAYLRDRGMVDRYHIYYPGAYGTTAHTIDDALFRLLHAPWATHLEVTWPTPEVVATTQADAVAWLKARKVKDE